MAGGIENNYGSSGQTLTCTLAGLASGSARASTAVANTIYQDALVFLQIKSGASSVTTTGTVAIYAYGSVNAGSTYTEGATGSDAAITLTSPPNVRLIGIMNMVANATTYYAGPFSVAAAFGGILPANWGIVVANNSGGAFDGSEGSHAKLYQGVYTQYT